METTVPPWAIRHVQAALRCGQQAAEIEASLIAKGLTAAQAASAVDGGFAGEFASQDVSQRRAFRLRWLQRSAALAVASIWLAVAFQHAGMQGLLRAGAGLLLPLACIWFPNELGSYAGASYRVSPRIDQPTPALFVALGGWLVLLGVPLIVLLLQ